MAKKETCKLFVGEESRRRVSVLFYTEIDQISLKLYHFMCFLTKYFCFR